METLEDTRYNQGIVKDTRVLHINIYVLFFPDMRQCCNVTTVLVQKLNQLVASKVWGQ